MGANEKHSATYHGGEYTPSELALITAWADHRRNLLEYAGEPFEGVVERTAQAQRTIAKIRAEAKAEAYKDAADALHAEARWQTDLLLRHEEYRFRHCANRMTEMENVMLARANQYKEGADNGR